MKPHRHAELIKLWADGAEIEARFLDADGWTNWRLQEGGFIWYQSNAEYRIKPELKKDTQMFVNVKNGYISRMSETKFSTDNLILIIDGETNELKDAKVIK